MRFDSPVWKRCFLMLCFIVASCGAAPGEADLDDMQTALWRAQQAVQGEQSSSLIASMETFERASARAQTHLGIATDAQRVRWSDLNDDMKQLLDDISDRPFVASLTTGSNGPRYFELQSRLME